MSISQNNIEINKLKEQQKMSQLFIDDVGDAFANIIKEVIKKGPNRYFAIAEAITSEKEKELQEKTEKLAAKEEELEKANKKIKELEEELKEKDRRLAIKSNILNKAIEQTKSLTAQLNSINNKK